MPHIVLTEEQARVVVEAGGTVEVRDPRNQPLASLTLLSPQDREAKGRFRQNGGKSTAHAEVTATLSSVPGTPEEEAAAVATFYDPVTFNWDENAFEVNKAVEDYCNSAYGDR